MFLFAQLIIKILLSYQMVTQHLILFALWTFFPLFNLSLKRLYHTEYNSYYVQDIYNGQSVKQAWKVWETPLWGFHINYQDRLLLHSQAAELCFHMLTPASGYSHRWQKVIFPVVVPKSLPNPPRSCQDSCHNTLTEHTDDVDRCQMVDWNLKCGLKNLWWT
jgi:hypothetical protein